MLTDIILITPDTVSLQIITKSPLMMMIDITILISHQHKPVSRAKNGPLQK